MRRTAGRVAAVAALSLLAAGCSAPFPASTNGSLPAASEMEIRVTEGPGTEHRFHTARAVVPGNVVQIRLKVADGEKARVELPSGRRRTAVVRAEGSDGSSNSIELSGAGRPIEIGKLTEFTPGYVGIEHFSDPGQFGFEISAPRVAGAAQGQVTFEFKAAIG